MSHRVPCWNRTQVAVLRGARLDRAGQIGQGFGNGNQPLFMRHGSFSHVSSDKTPAPIHSIRSDGPGQLPNRRFTVSVSVQERAPLKVL